MYRNDENLGESRQEFTLLELNNRIKGVIQQSFPDTYWVRAEMSDVRQHAASGHCYLEFVEKHPVNGQLLAKARGSIWAKTFRMIKPYFEMETGQSFASGIKVLVKVTVEFHELYGYSLTVVDIDPTYTLGDMVRRRMEIIKQLQEEGVFSLNKELDCPLLPQRIAVITSPSAAGYEDFMKQLVQNKSGYIFYTHLFPAIMQGEKTEESVIGALDKVYRHLDCFDVVVIIRGGGATSDLHSFDSYLLAANCAQFPLPIITGIGHERDDTVVDMVANTRMKTPTAVAEFLINRMDDAADRLNTLQDKCSTKAIEILTERKNSLDLLATMLPSMVTSRLTSNHSSLQLLGMKLPSLANNLLEQNRFALQRLVVTLPATAKQNMERKNSVFEKIDSMFRKSVDDFLLKRKHALELSEQYVSLASPENILRKGYSLIYKNGRLVKRSVDLHEGDELSIHFIDGDKKSRIVE